MARPVFYCATILFMTLRRIHPDPWWHVLGLSFGLTFVLLLMGARLYPAYMDAIDGSVQAFLAGYQTFDHVEFFLAVTILGSGMGVTLLALASAYVLRRNWFTVLQLSLVLLFSSVSMGIAKMFVERARPDVLLWLDPLNTYSFPSGHATLSTAFFGFLAVCLYRRIRSAVLRYLAAGVCIVIILLVCVSRLVLSYHYFTDVVAGIFLGLFWVAVVYMLPKPRC